MVWWQIILILWFGVLPCLTCLVAIVYKVSEAATQNTELKYSIKGIQTQLQNLDKLINTRLKRL